MVLPMVANPILGNYILDAQCVRGGKLRMSNWLAEHKSISIGGGIGVLLALGQIFSETVKQHPHWAIASAVVATGMIVIPLLYSDNFELPLNQQFE